MRRTLALSLNFAITLPVYGADLSSSTNADAANGLKQSTRVFSAAR